MVEDFQHTNCHRWIRRPDHIGLDPFGQETVRAMMHPGYQNPDYIGPAGPKDADLSILAVQSLDGCPLALLANYSMHYFGAQPVSADYFGLFAWKLAAPLKTANLEPPFVGIMSQGTSGDLHWMDYSEPQKPIDIGTYTDQIVEVVYQAWQQINYRDWLPYARTTPGSVIIVLSLWLLGLNSHTYAKLNTDLVNAMPITEQLPAHTILASGAGECALPNCPGEWNGFAAAFGQKPKYVDPFGHLECYLAIGQDVAYLNNYEADTDHFPTVYRQRNLAADYLVVRHTHAHQMETEKKEYNLELQSALPKERDQAKFAILARGNNRFND